MKIVKLSSFSTKDPKNSEEQNLSAPVEKSKRKNILNAGDVITVDLGTIVDLKRIDAHIRDIFNVKKHTFDQKQEALSSGVDLVPLDSREEVLNIRYLQSLMTEVEKLEEELSSFENYFNLAPQFLEMYSELLPENCNRVVGENDIVVKPDFEKSFITIVMQFVELAMRYTPKIKIINKSTTIDRCSCGGNTVIVDGTVFCISCSSKVKTKEYGASGASTGSEYHRLETFEDGLDYIQGRSKKPVPTQVYEAISHYCEMYSVNEEQLTKDEIISILKKSKLSEFYKSINLIRFTIQGRKLPSYEHIRATLLERHRLIEGEYIQIREEQGRNNFLNVYFVIRACIQMEGQPLNPDDFIVLTTVDALKDHNRIMHIICGRIKERQKDDKTIKGRWDFVSILN
jgi:hypothetical protein